MKNVVHHPHLMRQNQLEVGQVAHLNCNLDHTTGYSRVLQTSNKVVWCMWTASSHVLMV